MIDREKAYAYFKRCYPDVFERRDRLNEWCLICKEYAKLSMDVWKLMDMGEEERDAKM